MQSYRKYMPMPSSASSNSSPTDDVGSVSRPESSLNDNDAHADGGDDAGGGGPSTPRVKREWMNVDRFVHDCQASLRPFCAEFVQTQMFARFIDDRIAVDLERKAKEQLRSEAEAAFMRSRGVMQPTPLNERKEPPASVLKDALELLDMAKKDSRALLMRYSAAWKDPHSALDFLLAHLTWQRERDASERLSWESGEKKKSLFDLDTDPTQMKTHDQIMLFDEAIVAKHNRTVASRLSSHLMPTPFLSDTSSHLYVPFIPASPSWVAGGEDEWFVPALNEEGGVVFPVLDVSRWGDRKVSDLVWMEAGEKGRRWEAKMSEKRKKLELHREEKEKEERERKSKEKEGTNFVSRLWKGKGESGGAAPPTSAEAAESIELYVSRECGLKVEGKKRQLLPRSGDRVGRAELRSPRTLLGSQAVPVVAPREMWAAGGTGPSVSLSQSPPNSSSRLVASLSHQRSHSSHPILLSNGPPLSSLPVHLHPTPPPPQPSAGRVGAGLRLPPTKQEVLDAIARGGLGARSFTVGQPPPPPAAVRGRSPSRSSRSEVVELNFHPEPAPATPPPHVSPPAMQPPPIPPSLMSAALPSPTSPKLAKAPPPLPTKPVVRPAFAGLSIQAVAAIAPAPATGLQSPPLPLSPPQPPPLPTRVPSPTRITALQPPPSIAFTIQTHPPTRSRSVSRSSTSRPQALALQSGGGVGDALDVGTPSPQPVSPVSAGGAVGSAGSRVVMRTRPLPSVPPGRTRTRSGSGRRKESEDGKAGEEKERRDESSLIHTL